MATSEIYLSRCIFRWKLLKVERMWMSYIMMCLVDPIKKNRTENFRLVNRDFNSSKVAPDVGIRNVIVERKQNLLYSNIDPGT